jgi:glycerol-3-phosphate dehydrogenase (NAD(P)+)
MKNLAIIGAGGWGTALSIVLSRNFESVRIWVHEPDLVRRMNESRENDLHLRGFHLPGNVTASTQAGDVLTGADVVVVVTPSHHVRRVVAGLADHLNPSMLFVSATKGLENETLLRMSEVLQDVLQPKFAPKIAVLSGPTFAREIAAGEPAALVISSSDAALARHIQTAFSGPTFRLYTNDDPVGVEIGGALKNVIAIGAGICRGLGLGNNAIAALITRGLAEISRLAIAVGGNSRTLAGLAGLGDLVLTCTGDLSRNRTVGIELGKGRSLGDILGSMNMVAEGVQTTSAAVELALKHEVEMPIVNQMYAILHLGKSPRDGIRELMDRTLKPE